MLKNCDAVESVFCVPEKMKKNHWLVATHDALRHLIWKNASWLPVDVECSEAQTVEEARGRLQTKSELLVVYLDLPGGDPLGLVRAGTRAGAKVLTFGNYAHEARSAFDHGATGYLDVRDSPEEIAEAIGIMLKNGQKYICKRRKQAILSSLDTTTKGGRKQLALEKLSPTERAIWNNLAEGRTTREIRLSRGKSQKTIESHLKHIVEKLSCGNLKTLRNKAQEWHYENQ